MHARGRYPPGIHGGGRGGGMGSGNPSGPNPNFQYRNPNHQQYVQRNVGQSHQQFLQQNQQQWLRRNQAAADSTVEEVEKTVQSEAVDSR